MDLFSEHIEGIRAEVRRYGAKETKCKNKLAWGLLTNCENMMTGSQEKRLPDRYEQNKNRHVGSYDKNQTIPGQFRWCRRALKNAFVVPSRRVSSAARLPGTGGRRDQECSGVADPGARSGQGDPRGACVGADRGAECVFPCALDDVGDRGGDSACAVVFFFFRTPRLFFGTWGHAATMSTTRPNAQHPSSLRPNVEQNAMEGGREQEADNEVSLQVSVE